MNASEWLDLVNLAMALALFVTCLAVVRPANGTRPLLIGFMVSGLFALYVACVRVLNLQATTRPFFGIAFTIWLAVKLWAIYAAALHTPRPFRTMLVNAAYRVFGRNPHLDD